MAAAGHGGLVQVSVEGNIGCGKSTLLEKLQDLPAMRDMMDLAVEPVGEWQNVHGSGYNLLDEYYKDRKRYAYLFQNYSFVTRLQQWTPPPLGQGPPIRLCERSVFTTDRIFAPIVVKDNLMDPLEAAAYDAWFNPLLSAFPFLIPNAFVYLRADPEVCFQRLKRRARSEESGVPQAYLTAVHAKHDEWFVTGAQQELDLHCGDATVRGVLNGSKTHPALDGVPFLVVDCNSHLDLTELHNSKAWEGLTSAISNFLLEVSGDEARKEGHNELLSHQRQA